MKIVKIIDEYQVIVDAGSDDGIKCGTHFKVLSKPIEIIDKDTDINLGAIELDKAEIKATKVYDKMCICENAVNRSGGIYPTSSLIGGMGLNAINGTLNGMIEEEAIHEKLNINVNDLADSISYKETPIRVGDKVEKV